MYIVKLKVKENNETFVYCIPEKISTTDELFLRDLNRHVTVKTSEQLPVCRKRASMVHKISNPTNEHISDVIFRELSENHFSYMDGTIRGIQYVNILDLREFVPHDMTWISEYEPDWCEDDCKSILYVTVRDGAVTVDAGEWPLESPRLVVTV